MSEKKTVNCNDGLLGLRRLLLPKHMNFFLYRLDLHQTKATARFSERETSPAGASEAAHEIFFY